MTTAKKHLHRWVDSPHYRRWVQQRDRALELLHHNAQARATDEMRNMLTDVLMLARSSFDHLKNPDHPLAIDHFQDQVTRFLRISSAKLFDIYNDLITKTYLLSKASETEIAAQLTLKSVPNKITKQELFEYEVEETLTPLHQRLQLYMDRLSRKIVTMAQTSALNAPDHEAFLTDILSAFPKTRSVVVPRRVLKPLVEAEKKIKVDASLDYIDEDTWQDMVADYKNKHIPKWRSPEHVINIPTKEKEEWYAWEFERDMTHEFVQAVRDGQISGAKDAGITDFVVISIIDNDTCEKCCNGLGCVNFDKHLVSEVVEMTNGEQSVPPYHFNCRCTLAPATENIPAIPDDGSKSFEEWLAA